MTTQMAEETVSAQALQEMPPQAAMLQLLFGKHISYSLYAAARLGVADHMNGDAAAVEKLAACTGAQMGPLYRVMRLLGAVGVFEELPGRRFRLTQMGELLRSDAPGSLRPFAIQLGDAWSTRPWEHFTETVRTGVDGVTQAFGKQLFELLAEEPEQSEHFNQSMTALSAAMLEPILRAYDFGGVRRAADVGGGHGKLLASILKRYPEMTGVVFDLPEVVAGACGRAHLAGCEDRIEFEAGSFFERVPAGCDAYLMKFILHDWSDTHCETILRAIRKEMRPESRLVVIEQLVTPDTRLCPAKLLDIEMLALTVGGRERTEAEFREMFAGAGMRLTRVARTESPVSVLEARAV
jgi:hypothetical protein